MDKNVKQIKPMSCPICDKFFFGKLSKEQIEDGETPNSQQCSRCGWYYDLEQLANPDLEHQSNDMSLNEYKAWYKEKIKKNHRWEYMKEIKPAPTPHICPACGEYTFKDLNSYDICPVCGWEDTGFEEWPNEKPGPYMMSLNETKAWFAKQRKANPKFKAFPREKKKKQNKRNSQY